VQSVQLSLKINLPVQKKLETFTPFFRTISLNEGYALPFRPTLHKEKSPTQKISVTFASVFQIIRVGRGRYNQSSPAGSLMSQAGWGVFPTIVPRTGTADSHRAMVTPGVTKCPADRQTRS
jgi:hypothetical protein